MNTFMVNTKKISMSNWKKWTFLLIVTFSAVFTAQAQDASAATLYNEGLASLKSKDFQVGYDKTKAALSAAQAEENEEIVGLAKKNLAKASYYLGLKKLKAKSVDEAMTLFDEGIEANPEFPSIYKGKAQALNAKGQSVDAIKMYFKSAELSEKAGKAESAKKTVKKAGSVVSKLYSGKKYKKAIEAGNAFLEVKESHKVHYYLAKSYQKQKDNTNALTHINKAVELAGSDITDKYYWAQGNIAEAAGKKTTALAAYKKITAAKYKENATFKIKELEGK